MSNTIETRLVDLETKITYQDEIIENLNQVVIRQQKEIDEVNLKFDQLSKHISSQEDSKDIPPPHY